MKRGGEAFRIAGRNSQPVRPSSTISTAPPWAGPTTGRPMAWPRRACGRTLRAWWRPRPPRRTACRRPACRGSIRRTARGRSTLAACARAPPGGRCSRWRRCPRRPCTQQHVAPAEPGQRFDHQVVALPVRHAPGIMMILRSSGSCQRLRELDDALLGDVVGIEQVDVDAALDRSRMRAGSTV